MPAAPGQFRPNERTPWAVTPILLPTLEDVACGRNSAKLVPASQEEAAQLHREECKRVTREHFSTETDRCTRQPWAKNAAFHHYYKKHMTILGLKKALESSDSDSETSENYSTKLFRRRLHLPITKRREALMAEGRSNAEGGTTDGAAKVRVPWSYRCPSVMDLGVVGDDAGSGDEDPSLRAQKKHHHPKVYGKKVFPHGFEADNRYKEPKRERLRGRQAYERWLEESRDTPTNLPNPWEARTEQEAREKELCRRRGPTQEQRAHSCLLSPVEQTKIKIAEERKALEGTAPPRNKRDKVSTTTQLGIDRRIAEIAQAQQESFARHRSIMQLVQRIPIEDPLAGDTASDLRVSRRR